MPHMETLNLINVKNRRFLVAVDELTFLSKVDVATRKELHSAGRYGKAGSELKVCILQDLILDDLKRSLSIFGDINEHSLLYTDERLYLKTALPQTAITLCQQVFDGRGPLFRKKFKIKSES